MIVTKSWLQEYIDLSDITDEELNKRLNEIGLEVDSIEKIEIPKGVVIGEILECKKHPDANKLNVCQVNIGDEVVQIVCGASNVVDAKYVAVATVGTTLPSEDGEFKIKKAKLRGEESFGMICSSTEIGLPPLEDGIMILDNSIGELEIGKELNEYKKVADTVIEIELTANRGDALSIYGVARDLSAAFNKDLIVDEFKTNNISNVGIAKELSVNSNDINAYLQYTICETENIDNNFLQNLRLGFVKIDEKEPIDKLLRYTIHESGVILRAYDFEKLSNENKVSLNIEAQNNSTIEVNSNNKTISIVGVSQNKEEKATSNSSKIILEASYIEPDFVVEGVSANNLETDELYYNSSRGSEPNIKFGINRLKKVLSCNNEIKFANGDVAVGNKKEPLKIAINIQDLINIIGNNLKKSEIVNTLNSLGYKLQKVNEDSFAIEIPIHAHDIKNIQDIAEEILRIYGIDNIKSIPSQIIEKNRITPTYSKYKGIKELRVLAVGAGYFEALTYIFANKELLQKYGFETLKEEKELLNPIVKELNTLRSTILVNLIEAAARNVKYGKNSIPLFEVGTLFNKNREESQKIAFLYSGEVQRASISNSAKAKIIDIDTFTDSIGKVIGEFKLKACEAKNSLMHPYISAEIIKDNKTIGYLSKLHPSVAKEFNLKDTFIAEVELDSILPKHINAKSSSNFQAVNKDLSIVVDKELNFYDIAKELNALINNIDILQDFYPLDIYSDESLNNKKSLTIRFALQSDSKTLSDSDIESAMDTILNTLKDKFKAELR